MADNTLSQAKVIALLISTFMAYLVFAAHTDLGSFGLSSARYPEKWAMWRYPIVGLWLLLAYLLFVARNKKAYIKSYIHSLLFSGIVSLLLASLWFGSSERIAILGTAAIYTMIAALLSMSVKNHVWAGTLAGVLVGVQVIVDILVLGIAGSFRIH